MSEHGQVATCRMRCRIGGTAAFGVLATILAFQPSLAQDALVQGDAVATRFSGTVATNGGPPLTIDLDGPSAIGLRLGAPGVPPSGGRSGSFPELFRVPARDVGQVFAVAISPGPDPAIYLAATAAFGLHQSRSGGEWMAGQWGTGGGPGTIYRIGEPGARAEIFATIELDGRPNGGASLGDLTFDAGSGRLFVSDMETGFIHQLDEADGSEVGRYDHGTEGRPAFLDVEQGVGRSLDAVPFDPASAPRIADCAGGPFATTPACWNIADFRRRVWGLGLLRDGTGRARLYYSTWASQAFGNPAWSADPQEQLNAVWSVGLTAEGSFDKTDVRREFSLPGFFATAEDYARAGGSHPVAGIAFSGAGDMVLAERGGLLNLGLGEDFSFRSGAGIAGPSLSTCRRRQLAPDRALRRRVR